MDSTQPIEGATFSFPSPPESQSYGLSAVASDVRAKLMDGLASVEDFAAAAGKSKRTVYGWIEKGMPSVRIGRTSYVAIEDARAWLLKPSTRNHAPRKPGRPRKAA
jgi:hypothetical protein